MQVYLSTSSSEDITHVLCVGLSFFFSLLSCFPSHKPLLNLSAKSVNSFFAVAFMARALVSFSGLAWWCCGAGAQLTAPTCFPWLLSKSLGWQSTVRAETSQGQHRSALLRGQKFLWHVHRKTSVKPAPRCRGCVERQVLAGVQISGTGIGSVWVSGREGIGLNGAEVCKVSVVSRGSRRFLMVLGVGMGLLSPPPFSPWICALTQGVGKKGEGKDTPVCLSPAWRNLCQHHILTSATRQCHIQRCREGMSAPRVAQVARTASSYCFLQKGQEKTSNCAKAVSRDPSRFYSHLLCLCLNLAQLIWRRTIIWNYKLCMCVYTQ